MKLFLHSLRCIPIAVVVDDDDVVLIAVVVGNEVADVVLFELGVLVVTGKPCSITLRTFCIMVGLVIARGEDTITITETNPRRSVIKFWRSISLSVLFSIALKFTQCIVRLCLCSMRGNERFWENIDNFPLVCHCKRPMSSLFFDCRSCPSRSASAICCFKGGSLGQVGPRYPKQFGGPVLPGTKSWNHGPY